MQYSFQSCRVREGAIEFVGLRGIKVEAKVEGGKVVFTNRIKGQDHTRGQVSVAGSMKMLLLNAKALIEKGRFLTTIHTFTISLAEGAIDDKLSAIGVRFTSFPMDLNGNDETEVDMPFNGLDFKVNGISIAPEIEEGG